ncbi:MAG: hypothetical protein J0G32_06490 [Alphaproteobacteria bacterium]|nr:hypothetical protein [Alphaproteobacteria bacterium]OJV12257.1 MAG: hypothetical protein BGO27_05935 [Alphaproteobacteria bacterium 33-17]
MFGASQKNKIQKDQIGLHVKQMIEFANAGNDIGDMLNSLLEDVGENYKNKNITKKERDLEVRNIVYALRIACVTEDLSANIKPDFISRASLDKIQGFSKQERHEIFEKLQRTHQLSNFVHGSVDTNKVTSQNVNRVIRRMNDVLGEKFFDQLSQDDVKALYNVEEKVQSLLPASKTRHKIVSKVTWLAFIGVSIFKWTPIITLGLSLSLTFIFSGALTVLTLSPIAAVIGVAVSGSMLFNAIPKLLLSAGIHIAEKQFVIDKTGRNKIVEHYEHLAKDGRSGKELPDEVRQEMVRDLKKAYTAISNNIETNTRALPNAGNNDQLFAGDRNSKGILKDRKLAKVEKNIMPILKEIDAMSKNPSPTYLDKAKMGRLAEKARKILKENKVTGSTFIDKDLGKLLLPKAAISK